ncbi:hypothetical protein [Maribacter spongiicola]|uniref:hypothetical protein n=1 Tax=Maribacter spongiicola TaxID=1206753 RepID=UPI003F98F133
MWKKDTQEVDGSMPEEWIMSTITARRNGRLENDRFYLVKAIEVLIKKLNSK